MPDPSEVFKLASSCQNPRISEANAALDWLTAFTALHSAKDAQEAA